MHTSNIFVLISQHDLGERDWDVMIQPGPMRAQPRSHDTVTRAQQLGQAFLFTVQDRLGFVTHNNIPPLSHLQLDLQRGPAVPHWMMHKEPFALLAQVVLS